MSNRGKKCTLPSLQVSFNSVPMSKMECIPTLLAPCIGNYPFYNSNRKVEE